jgi:hypothetical protein
MAKSYGNGKDKQVTQMGHLVLGKQVTHLGHLLNVKAKMEGNILALNQKGDTKRKKRNRSVNRRRRQKRSTSVNRRQDKKRSASVNRKYRQKRSARVNRDH